MPPNATETVVDPDTSPLFACRSPLSEFESCVVPETVRAEVDAELENRPVAAKNVVVVAESVSKPVKCEVDEAKSPPNAKSGDVVAAVVVPKEVCVVNGKAKFA